MIEHCDIVAEAVNKIKEFRDTAPKLAQEKEVVEQKRQEVISEVMERTGETDYNIVAKFVADATSYLRAQENTKKALRHE